MKIARECITCFARQAVEIAKEVTQDVGLQEKIIKASLAELAHINFEETAPELAYRMHQHAKRLSGNSDPYLRLKETYNAIALRISAFIEEEQLMDKSDDPFDLACRLAIAGNIIDFSVGLDLDEAEIFKSMHDSLTAPLFGSGSQSLKEAVNKAKSILYLADNSGEIVFDKFLVSELPRDKVTYVVKGGPIVNDATMVDAMNVGMVDLVRVIDNGHDAQGTVLHACSEAFQQAFEAADLIISKGQANFETLSHRTDKVIYYLLRAKCHSVAQAIGCQKMDYVLNAACGNPTLV